MKASRVICLNSGYLCFDYPHRCAVWGFWLYKEKQKIPARESAGGRWILPPKGQQCGNSFHGVLLPWQMVMQCKQMRHSIDGLLCNINAICGDPDIATSVLNVPSPWTPHNIPYPHPCMISFHFYIFFMPKLHGLNIEKNKIVISTGKDKIWNCRKLVTISVSGKYRTENNVADLIDLYQMVYYFATWIPKHNTD